MNEPNSPPPGPERIERARRLLAGGDEPDTTDEARVGYILAGVRGRIATRDVVLFCVVRVWITVAHLVAPLLAAGARSAGQERPFEPRD